MQIAANYYAAAYSQIAGCQAGYSVSGTYLEIMGGTGSSPTDGVEVSDLARQLADKIKALDVFKLIFPDNDVRKEAKSLDDIAGEFSADFTSFADMFSRMTSMMGMTGSFTMGLDGVGGVTVDGSDEAAAAKLQAGLGANQTFVARFAVMAARAALVDARSTVGEFDDAYSRDPFAAIIDNIDALKERLLGFRTESDGGSTSYGFVRSFSASIEIAVGSAVKAGEAGQDAVETTGTEATETAPAEIA